MKNLKIILLILCASFSCILHAQPSSDNNPQNNIKGPTYDSLKSVFSNKNISFEDKYELRKKIVTEFTSDQLDTIFSILLSYAKKAQHPQAMFDMYRHFAGRHFNRNNAQLTRLYLDSAKVYLDKVNHDPSLARYYSIEGGYYCEELKEEIGHQYFYKAIEHYEKTGKNHMEIVRILRDMTVGHFKRDDTNEVWKLIQKMEAVTLTAPEATKPFCIFSIDEIAGGYYRTLYRKNQEKLYLDSAQQHYARSIGLYESLDDLTQQKQAKKMMTLYSRNVETELEKQTPDWQLITRNAAKARTLCPPTDTMRLAFIHMLDAAVYVGKKQFDRAEEEIKRAEYLSDRNSGTVAYYYLDIYQAYINLYKRKGDFQNALKYVEKYNQIKGEFTEERQFQQIKELDVKYETARKDLQIAGLEIDKQREQHSKTLIASVSIFLIVLLTLFWLYNYIQRLKKQKEAALLLNRIAAKDNEYQTAIDKSKIDTMKSYLNGLEKERERLAKELHDNIANELLSIDHQLREVDTLPQNITGQIEQLHAEIRNISHELMPPVFKYANLSEIVTDYVAKLNQRKQFSIQCDLPEEYLLADLPDHLSFEIYRMIQEALGNVVKHSQATLAKLTFQLDDDNIRIRLEDNGKGFDREQRTKGIGLQIIRDRVQSLNGTLSIVSSPGQGCVITITLPLSQPDDNR